MEYYYTPSNKINLIEQILVIDDEFEYKHLAKVLRKKPGDTLQITDGELKVYDCIIESITRNEIKCNITNVQKDLYEPDKRIHLFIAPLKNSDRFEFAIEKAVELGVVSITPIITRYTINKSALNETKLKRLHRIIISAMGQSQRCLLPKLNNISKFNDLIRDTTCNKNKIVMYEFSGKDDKFVYDNTSNDISLLIGPEGGFSKEEIGLLRDDGWQVGSLGERKLRAETAAIVSIFELLNCN